MRRMQALRRALGLTLALWPAVSMPVAAQGLTTAALHGVVTGRDSAGLEEAVVTVTNAINGERWRAVTGTGGRYLVEYLSLGGPYTVEARAVGYAPITRSGIMLSLGERRRADLRLTPVVLELPGIAVAGIIDPALSVGRTGPTQTISQRLGSGLALQDRDFSRLALLSPQAILTGDQGISIAGQSDRLNNLQIDGTNNNDFGGIMGTGGSGTIGTGARTLSVEALQELQVLAAPFDVRFGMFAGGQVNAVTRSGSNRWEGTVSSYFQTEGLTGRDDQGRRAGEFSSKEATITLGGPIVRDRVTLFLDAGLQRFAGGRPLAIGTDTTGGADSVGIGVRRSSAERFQTILSETYGVDAGSITPSIFRFPAGYLFGKVTIWPALNQRIEVSHNYAENERQIPGGCCTDGEYRLSSEETIIPTTVNATRLTWTAAGQAGFSNELTLSRVAATQRCVPRSHFADVVVVPVDDGQLAAGTNRICGERFGNSTTWELTDNLSWPLGAHRITVGTHNELVRLEGKDRSTSFTAGTWVFESLDHLARGEPIGFIRTVPGPARPEGARSDIEVRQVGLYLQDQWGALPNLSLTAGLRFDVPFLADAPVRNAMLADSLGVSTALTPSGHLLWSPRLGANFDVGGHGTTFLRGGVGLFSGRPIYLYFSNVYETTGESRMLECFVDDVPTFTSLDPAVQPASCASGDAGAPVVSVFDRSFRFPRNLRLALGADVRLPGGLVGTVDLLYIRGLDQLDFIDLNLAPPTASSPGEGGRVLYGRIKPASGGTDPYRRTYAFGRVTQMRNSSGDRTVSAAVQLQKRHRVGELSLAYTYTDARDRISPIGFDLPSNLDLAPLDGTLEHRRLTTSLFEAVHKISLGGVLDLPARFRLGVFYNGFSGYPFTYLIDGDANGDGLPNDIVYVPRDASDITLADPTEWAALARYIRAESCLQEQRGRIMRRNSCRAHWHTELNARLSSVIPTVRGQSIELIADLFNVLNLLDRDWGVQRRYPNAYLLRLVGYDEANGRGTYDMLRVDRRIRDTEATRWRLQLGARYGF